MSTFAVIPLHVAYIFFKYAVIFIHQLYFDTKIEYSKKITLSYILIYLTLTIMR